MVLERHHAASGAVRAQSGLAGQFDIDGPMAVETRKKLLDRAAADRTLVQGYHFPFPASGHIVKTATGYEHVPLLWNIAV